MARLDHTPVLHDQGFGAAVAATATTTGLVEMVVVEE